MINVLLLRHVQTKIRSIPQNVLVLQRRFKKAYPRDPGGAKNNTVEHAQYEKEREEAAEKERHLAEIAAAETAD